MGGMGTPCRLVTLKSKYRSVLEPLSRLLKIFSSWGIYVTRPNMYQFTNVNKLYILLKM